MSSSKVTATITLSTGEKSENKYILRPSVDGNILIGNEATIHESSKKIMLPKQNILYIEFEKINYFFGQELESKNDHRTIEIDEGIVLTSRKYKHRK